MKALGPCPLLLSIAISLLLFFSIGAANPTPEKTEVAAERPEVVWRGEQEKRGPADIKRDGGFRALGLHRDLIGGMPTEVEREAASSLYIHAAGFDLGATKYISTTTDPMVAASYAHIRGVKPGYVYLIHTDPKFVDVYATLGEAVPFPFDKEHVAVGLIPWHQVVGWFDLSEPHFKRHLLSVHGSLGKLKGRAGEEEEEVEGFYRNEDFDSRYLPKRGSGGQPQLAGFAPSSAYWERPPWNKFVRQSSADNLEQFVVDHVHAPRGEDESVWSWALTRPSEEVTDSVKTVEKAAEEKSSSSNMDNCCRLHRRGLVVVVQKRGCIPCKSTTTAGESRGKMKRVEPMAMAQKSSKEAFDALLHQFGHGNLATHQDQLHAQLDRRLQEMRELSRLDKINHLAHQVGADASRAAGLAIYGYAVADVFSHEAGVLDKAAVLTSVLPVIGCSVQTANHVARGTLDPTRLALCFAQDALVISGLWEFALSWQTITGVWETLTMMDEQDQLYDSDVFKEKRIRGWQSKIQELEKYIDSNDFLQNVTHRFSAFQVGLLFQASQLVGDLHASHHIGLGAAETYATEKLADKAQKMISLAMEPEMERQICIETARNKIRVLESLKGSLLDLTRKLAKQYDDQFFDQYWQAATGEVDFLGFIPIRPPPVNMKELREAMMYQKRNGPLPLYQERIHQALRRAVERIETPASCLCRQEEKQKCEFADCSSPKAAVGKMDAGGRVFFSTIMSMDDDSISSDCKLRFLPCWAGASSSSEHAHRLEALEIGPRQMWCKAAGAALESNSTQGMNLPLAE
ncbi:putative enterotoxin [Ophiocordyceps unilateralis]|uniref:Enterotoxin n=1 Tax=Ophiocordyceps unilateralis TaxID=268505 RepID=A0A2A9P4J3_OPHUN|nr:putative enterotoxin [Ophiocordyceps unilateralis]